VSQAKSSGPFLQRHSLKYISPSNISASVETRPPQLHNSLQFTPALPSLTFYGPPLLHVFLVLVLLLSVNIIS